AVRRPRVEAVELERFNFLRCAILEDFEVVGGQTFDDPAVLPDGIRVDAHQLCPAAEHRPLPLDFARGRRVWLFLWLLRPPPAAPLLCWGQAVSAVPAAAAPPARAKPPAQSR